MSYNLTSNFANSQISASGRTQLKPDYPSSIDANLSNLPLERVLAAVKPSRYSGQGRGLR